MTNSKMITSMALRVCAWTALGATRARGQEMLWKWNGDQYQQKVGSQLDLIGDLTGDGIPEIIAGVPWDSGAGSDAGMVRILSGQDGSEVYSLFGSAPSDTFGWSIANLGDVDADGIGDFVVGAPRVTNTILGQGEVTIFSGGTGQSICSVYGTASRESLGWALATIGDVNGDGIADFAVGSSAKQVLVLSGKDGSLIWTLTALKATGAFGHSLGAGGDVDGDGIGDVIVGDVQSNLGVKNGGAAYVFSGASGSLLYDFASTTIDALFGQGVTIAGDIDRDGFADLLVGAPGDDRVVSDGGYAALYSGADGHLLASFQSTDPQNGWYLGYCVRGVGDVNGDGYLEFAIGAPSLGGANSLGAMFIYSGLDDEVLYHYQDPAYAFGVGASIAPTADFDGDGHVDFVLGSPNEDNGSISGAGSVSVWRGHDLNIDLWPHFATGSASVSAIVGQGVPGNVFALFVTNLNGNPVFALAGVGWLDTTGRGTLKGTMPGAPGSNVIGLQAFTLDTNGKLLRSGIEELFTQ